ncbi:MAG: type II secretion system F family protein [Propionibacteriales bacterium]|nr:type II secretion system F family protein [Propionibacteriales bacterium]
MNVAACLCAAVAVWLVLPAPATARHRTLLGAPPPRRRASPQLMVTLLVPVACLVVLGPVPGAGVALVATPLARAAVTTTVSAAERRRRDLVARQLPGALDLLVAVLASGRPVVVALDVVAGSVPAPLRDDLQGVVGRLRSGADAAAVWDVLARHPTLAMLARGFRRAEQSGAPVAAVLAATAADVRRDVAARSRERARAVAVRTAAPLGLCFLPAFLLVGIVPSLLGVASGLDLLGG